VGGIESGALQRADVFSRACKRLIICRKTVLFTAHIQATGHGVARGLLQGVDFF
jgi:hypothetical protein